MRSKWKCTVMGAKSQVYESRPQVHVLSDTSHKLINMYAKSRQSGSRNDKNMRVRRAGRTRETRERGESKR